jgi:hypothetical protein
VTPFSSKANPLVHDAEFEQAGDFREGYGCFGGVVVAGDLDPYFYPVSQVQKLK